MITVFLNAQPINVPTTVNDVTHHCAFQARDQEEDQHAHVTLAQDAYVITKDRYVRAHHQLAADAAAGRGKQFLKRRRKKVRGLAQQLDVCENRMTQAGDHYTQV
jgi:ABC-type transporter lipoprotein component MlaA